MVPVQTSGSRTQNASGAIGRTFAVLYALAGRRGVSFGDLERACDGVARATLVRLLKTLLAAGLVEKNQEGLYALGSESFHFARTVLQLMSRGELVGPALAALADATSESAAYFEFDGVWIKLLNKVEKPNSFHYIPVGDRTGRPRIHVFARVILAFSRDDHVRRVLGRDMQATARDKAREKKWYQTMREAGVYAAPEEPGTPITRVVAPVLGADGIAVGSIGVTLLGDRLAKKRLDECSAHVLDAAARAREMFLRGAES